MLGTAAQLGLGAGTGAATAATGIPWFLLPILMDMGIGAFGQSDEERRAEQLKEIMKILQGLGMEAPYQSPYLEKLDPVIAQALASQMQRTANWGWPEGMGMDTTLLDQFIQSMQGAGTDRSFKGAKIPFRPTYSGGGPGQMSGAPLG